MEPSDVDDFSVTVRSTLLDPATRLRGTNRAFRRALADTSEIARDRARRLPQGLRAALATAVHGRPGFVLAEALWFMVAFHRGCGRARWAR